MKIIGAGMTGCLAGLIFPEAQIIEKQKELPINHGAVLRFRDESVSRVTGIPFRKVTVRKGIYYHGNFVEPDIGIANAYSYKVLGVIADRSIWNLESVKRYIAPPNFQKQLIDKVKDRINLEAEFDLGCGETFVSTIPINNMLQCYTDIECNELFNHQEIFTARYKLLGVDVFQTIYYPDSSTGIYRASITGDNLIIESVSVILDEEVEMVLKSFCIFRALPVLIENKHQGYGKIAQINENVRKGLLFELTSKYNVYSAGRYAIWKNVLMDDVLQDLYIIKRMIETNPYNRLRLEIENES